ncbi:uncharacterized protein LOC123670812 [Harmonia axyridis]|uniref:uncharacterized protein LOC123670812 n=1 Tax=Harmonia axyridis TaxID=115357 RepID=UPI001E279C81|nr:uncharacterized protein LOC123670812 [Harmonia axyridis]
MRNMPGVSCSVATCRNNSIKAKETGENLMFLRFPKDFKIQKEWVRKCAKKDEWNPNHKRICSLHFKLDDYEDEMKARLMNIKPKKLKIDEELSIAFTLRYLSKRAYIYVRESLHYPLPGLSTLQRWAANINYGQGSF